MSLTGLLRSGRGPVWDWFEANLPETQRVCTGANRELRGGGAKEPCAVPPVPGTDHGLVGTAVGYLLSAHLRPDALNSTVATEGAVRLEGPLRRLQVPPSVIERLTVERIAKLQPSQRPLDGEQWSELCRLVMILARFEQYVRAGHRVLPHIAEPIITYSGDLDELALALASEPSMRDLDTLGRITLEDHLGIRDAQDLAMGPNFAQSAALGGADADLIYDGTLLDLKSSCQARIVGRDEVWQLIGYLLADTDHRYNIARVGFTALRRRRSIFWSADDLIHQLSAGQPCAVEQLREQFATLLARLPERQGFAATGGSVKGALGVIRLVSDGPRADA
jgi:hypothetical protein